MGEAKRRKKLDPTFGKYEPTFEISKGKITQNWVVKIDGFCIDSSIDYAEAMQIKTWLEEEHRVNPLKRPQSGDTNYLLNWIKNSQRYKDYPVTTSEFLVWDAVSKSYHPILYTE